VRRAQNGKTPLDRHQAAYYLLFQDQTCIVRPRFGALQTQVEPKATKVTKSKL
jgi:hypothetical protein